MLTPLIVAVFLIGYLFITLEDVIKVNKAAVALLMCVACWKFIYGGNLGYSTYSNSSLSAFLLGGGVGVAVRRVGCPFLS